MKNSIDYSLYLVTDPGMAKVELPQAVEQAILGGVTLVQLREKQAGTLDFYQQALAIKRVCDAHAVPLIINDRIDIALAIGAAGVHIGQDDMPLCAARRILGENAIIGVSASTLAQAQSAYRGGADYLGIGALQPTSTKTDATITPYDELQRIRRHIPIPLVAIGGINLATLAPLRCHGLQGIAVVSAILAAEDIQAAARALKEAWG